jgi:hypothetical protein
MLPSTEAGCQDILVPIASVFATAVDEAGQDERLQKRRGAREEVQFVDVQGRSADLKRSCLENAQVGRFDRQEGQRRFAKVTARIMSAKLREAHILWRAN